MRVQVMMMVVVMVMAGGVLATLKPPERSYKILMLLMASSPSHRNVFVPIAEALADRGHQVEILSSLPDFSTSRRIIQHFSGINFMDIEHINMFKVLQNEIDEFEIFVNVTISIVDEVYKSPAVQELYSRRKTFDLFVTDHLCNEMSHPFLHEMPFITVAAPGMDPMQSAMLGNVQNPAFTPSLLATIPPPWNVYQRLANTAAHLLFPFFYNHWYYLPKLQNKISSLFPNLPPLKELTRNQSLTLLNTHFSLDMPYPLLPSQVEVGALHCRPGNPLPQDLDSWMEGAGEAGVVYFSLGSITKGTKMPAKYRDLFIQAFSRLDQRVIWKYEGALPGVSDNVLIKPWMPQQDILSDPRVKMFMSHGGLLGTQEAIYHAKPILALPIHGDQPRNAQNIANKGIGLYLNWDELSADLIVYTIQEIINNSRYKRKIENMSRALKDQVETPQDLAVYWTEYVIRHKGAPHLRSPAASLSWVEFLMLDVVCGLLLAAVMTVLVLRKIALVVVTVAFTGRTKTNTLK
ncbi:UDP-glycosyltransferase UGT5-like [Procambarus clarkii]|uniref:UDP-glycosyltransferase UGT5-like n=1 Tax=Procambarus clarkii TaxID=6728 RepID=UPI0037444599